MKLLITGIAGFVGSRLARFFLGAQSDLEIWSIDSRHGSEHNLACLEQIVCCVVHGNTRCPSDLEPLPVVDGVIDCAANSSVLAGLESVGSAIGHNLIGLPP